MKCPDCHTESTGAYCPACGAPVEGARCKSCEAALVPGARYCVQCGVAARAASSNASSNKAVAVLGTLTAVLALLVVVLVAAYRGGRDAGPGAAFAPAGAAASAGTPGRAPPLTGTPREQADQLFNRVMQSLAMNDSAQASFFLPMAILAYRQAGELDADGHFHLAVLETTAGNYAAALEAADRILTDAPDHLLALGAAARAALQAGDTATARRFYEHLLRVYDEERARERPEYRDHAQILPDYRDEARRFVEGS